MRPVIFLGSARPSINRSWNPTAAATALAAIGFTTSEEVVDSVEHLQRITPRLSKALVWPTSYTMGADNCGLLINEYLQRHDISFIGSPYQDLAVSSKLALKRRLVCAGVPTPRAVYSHQLNADSDPPFPFPVVVKAEYSSTSVGVARAGDRNELREAVAFNRTMYGQESVIEEWCRTREYTVAIVGCRPVVAIAPIEICIAPGHGEILDSGAKADYKSLTFGLPPVETIVLLQRAVQRMLPVLQGGDYFRVDILENDRGELLFIDFNFLPGLSNVDGGQSFFPMALAANYGLSFEQSIALIIRCALQRSGLSIPTSLNALLPQGPLVAACGDAE